MRHNALFCSKSCSDKYDTDLTNSWAQATETQKLELFKKMYEKMVIRKSEEDCWGWKGIKDTDGRAILKGTHSKRMVAHKVSWIITYGEESMKNKYIYHNCDNKICTNPLHLFVKP